MNLLGFRYFLEVANTLNFSKASKQLHVSQPGLSQQITSLEKNLGFKLFKRTTRKVTLTEEGEYLYGHLSPSFENIENIITDLKNKKAVPQTVLKMASVPSAASNWIPKLLTHLHQELQDIEFYLRETTSVQAMNLVKEQKIHLAFIRTPLDKNEGIDQRGLHSMKFTEQPLKLVVSSNHRFSQRTSIDLREMRKEPFLHYDPKQSPSLYSLVERACLTAGFIPKTFCVGPEILTIEKLISHELGVTIMPQDMVNLLSSQEITSIDIEQQNLTSSITMIWKNTDYTPLVTQHMIKMAHSILHTEDS